MLKAPRPAPAGEAPSLELLLPWTYRAAFSLGTRSRSGTCRLRNKNATLLRRWRDFVSDRLLPALAEALGEVVGSGLGHDLGLLEGGGIALLQQDALVVGTAHGQLDGLVLPGGARRAL